MNKKIDFNKSIYELTQEYPELVDMMVLLGFTPIANPAIRKTVGRIMTIPKGAEMMDISMEKIVSVLKENGFAITEVTNIEEDRPSQKGHEAGHTFLARMGKTRLRPGGIEATSWLLAQADIRSETNILEVACNMGTTMIQIAKQYGCHVTGLDLDGGALQKAAENVKEQQLEDKIALVEGSAFKLPFPDAAFDIVINEAMLTMLIGDEKDKALREYARVLKPGGLLLTQDVFLRRNDMKTCREIIAGISRAINVHVEPLTEKGWKKKMESHGFSCVVKTGNMTLLDPEGMIHDEGEEITSKIIKNGTQKENIAMFMGLFDFFNNHKQDIGYIAMASVKQETEGKKQ